MKIQWLKSKWWRKKVNGDITMAMKTYSNLRPSRCAAGKKELFIFLRLTVGLNEKSAENEQMENKIRYSQRVEDERLKQIYQEMEDQLQIDREAIRRFLLAVLPRIIKSL